MLRTFSLPVVVLGLDVISYRLGLVVVVLVAVAVAVIVVAVVVGHADVIHLVDVAALAASLDRSVFR